MPSHSTNVTNNCRFFWIFTSASPQYELIKCKFSAQCSLPFWIHGLSKVICLHCNLVGKKPISGQHSQKLYYFENALLELVGNVYWGSGSEFDGYERWMRKKVILFWYFCQIYKFKNFHKWPITNATLGMWYSLWSSNLHIYVHILIPHS